MDSKLVENIAEKAATLGSQILLGIIFFFIGAQFIKFVRRIARKAMDRVKAEQGVIQFVDSFIKAAMYIILVFMLASYFGIQTASIVALLGSAGVAIGLAVQGSLSNFAGGVLILLLKPFKVGDYIVENGGHMEGTVAEITIFYTKLRTVDNKTVILPNGNLANNSLINVTAQEVRRLDIPVSISYDSDIRKAKEVLIDMLQRDGAILPDRERIVVVDDLAASGINLIVRGWVKTEDYWTAKWRITEQCKYTLDNAGITIPFPQLDVHMMNRN